MNAKPNRSAYVVLGLLGDGPRSGYDIKRAIDEVTSHFWRESYGQIYPVLAQLVRRRLVTRARKSRGRRERFEYALTTAGRAALRDWLLEPPQAESVRHELLLKVFFGATKSPDVLAGHVREFRSRNQALQQALAAGLDDDEATGDANLHVRLTMLNGLYIAEARVRWADEALRELQRREQRRQRNREKRSA